MKYVLGVDIGTTNAKAVAYAVDGKVIAHASRSYTFSSEEEGYHELDPSVLFNSVIEVIQDAVKEANDHEIAGAAFSSAMHGLMAVDVKGTPLTAMITWADLRSKAYANKLKNTPAGNRIYERTGTPVHPMSPLCKLMWMKDQLPEIFKAAHKFISIKEYIYYRFFNEYIIDHSVASSTGLFDIYDLDWNKEALREAGITADKLSIPVPATYIIKGLKNDFALLLGIDADTPFIAGGSDGCLAHIGSNALMNGDVSLTIGTSGAVRIMTNQPLYDKKQRIFNYLLDDGLYISGGPVNNGGNVLQWFANNFLRKPFSRPADVTEFIDEAMSVSPGADGIIFLPFIYGERAPVWDADARGTFYGINGTHTVTHFMRAVMEGISFGISSVFSILEQMAGPFSNIYVSGGFIRSHKWVQLMADVLGKKLLVTSGDDSSAVGAAIIGMKALGIIGNFEEAQTFFTVEESFEPNPTNHRIYKESFGTYLNIFNQLKDLKK